MTAFVNSGYPTVRGIAQIVAQRYGVDFTVLISTRRDLKSMEPRHVAMWLARRLTPCSFPIIGRVFGGRDHTTVLHACARIDRLRENDPVLRKSTDALLAELRNRWGVLEVTRAKADDELIERLRIELAATQHTARDLAEKLRHSEDARLLVERQACQPELSAFAAAWRDFESSIYGRGEHLARKRFERAASALAKAHSATAKKEERNVA